jgi:hypothetical protein
MFQSTVVDTKLPIFLLTLLIFARKKTKKKPSKETQKPHTKKKISQKKGGKH